LRPSPPAFDGTAGAGRGGEREFPFRRFWAITHSASSPRRFLGQEPPDYGGCSAHHKAAGDTGGGRVIVDHHHAALARRCRRGRQGSQHVACRRFVLDDRVQQSLAGAGLRRDCLLRSPGSAILPGIMGGLRPLQWLRTARRRDLNGHKDDLTAYAMMSPIHVTAPASMSIDRTCPSFSDRPCLSGSDRARPKATENQTLALACCPYGSTASSLVQRVDSGARYPRGCWTTAILQRDALALDRFVRASLANGLREPCCFLSVMGEQAPSGDGCPGAWLSAN
jgi:hypothetical protein